MRSVQFKTLRSCSATANAAASGWLSLAGSQTARPFLQSATSRAWSARATSVSSDKLSRERSHAAEPCLQARKFAARSGDPASTDAGHRPAQATKADRFLENVLVMGHPCRGVQ